MRVVKMSVRFQFMEQGMQALANRESYLTRFKVCIPGVLQGLAALAPDLLCTIWSNTDQILSNIHRAPIYMSHPVSGKEL